METEDQNFDATDNTGGEESSNGGNPAWTELYSVLPDNLHPLVSPVLEKWEQGTQQKFQQYAETTKQYEPYQGLIEQGVAPDQIEQALAVAQLIDSDPQGFLKQMQAFYGDPQSQQPEPQQQSQDNSYDQFDEQPFDIENDPRFQQLKQQQDLIAGFLAQQVEAEQAQNADQQLDSEIQSLTEQYGEFDEDYVFGLALNGVPLEDAVQRYHSMVENVRTRPAADANLPNIIAPGGGLPSEQVNPADMTDAQRKAFVMNALAQANQQS
jgi:hypothetical protein